jgi:hypothetical protein
VASRAPRLAAVLAVAAALAACTGMTETRLAAAPGRAPLSQLVVLIDKDVIGSAFAAYKGTLPLGPKTGDFQGFIDHLVSGVQAEAQAAGIDATVEVVSARSRQASSVNTALGRPVLMIRATSFTTRKDAVGGRDLGWAGDTAWEFSLAERPATGPYAKTWVAGIKSENLNPTLCGNYDGCSKALAVKVFSQMRKDGVVR